MKAGANNNRPVFMAFFVLGQRHARRGGLCNGRSRHLQPGFLVFYADLPKEKFHLRLQTMSHSKSRPVRCEKSFMQRRIDVKLNGNGSPSSEFGKCAEPNAEVDIDDSTCNPTLCFENIRIRQGVRLVVANHTLRQRVHIAYEIDRAPISFSYTLSERVRCTMRHGLRTRRVAERLPGDGILAYLPQTTGTIDIFADRRVLGVSLHFSVTAFKDLYPWLPSDLQHLDADPGGQSALKPV